MRGEYFDLRHVATIGQKIIQSQKPMISLFKAKQVVQYCFTNTNDVQRSFVLLPSEQRKSSRLVVDDLLSLAIALNTLVL
jgi:hypothetical protein